MLKYFYDFQNQNLSVFVTKVNLNNANEIKSYIFHGTCSNLTSFFIVYKILKYFNDFYN